MGALVYFLIFVVCFIKICLLQKLDEKCNVDNETSGYCTYAKNCSIDSLYFSNTINENSCDPMGLGEIICCPFYNAKKHRNSKSVEKCLEYSNLNMKKRYERNIAGGYRALPGEFSHVAALGYLIQNKTIWNCGGTLISEQYVLTAAHCLNTKIGKVKYVRLGDIDLDSDEDMVKPQTFEAQKLIEYPHFQRKQKLNDIGLIKLNQTAQFGIHIFPACLYVNKKIVYDTLTAIGWGASYLNSDISKSLMKVNLDVYSNKKCRKFYNYEHGYKILRGRQFCAGRSQDVGDTCQGASGGPLLTPTYFNRNIHYVIGIVSFGPRCGQINNPGIYTKVGYYVSWIESVVWP